MELIHSVSAILHRIRVKLYPSHLPGNEGAYIARTDSEAALSIEQVCAALTKRGGYNGRCDDIVKTVTAFFNEAAYQLSDGYAVNTRYFSITPIVRGTFKSADEANDHRKHPIDFSFLPHAPMRRLAKNIAIEIEGIADNPAYIDEFIDIAGGTANETVTPEGIFVIHGHWIKLVGDNPNVGIYFESTENKAERVKVHAPLVGNTASKIIGVAPDLPGPGPYRVVIVTQFSHGGQFIKEPRTVTAPFELITG